MDERLKIALQTTITRFEELRQFGKTKVPCGLCLAFKKDSPYCKNCPLQEYQTDQVGCMSIPFGGFTGNRIHSHFSTFAASCNPVPSYIEVNDRRRYINACIKFYSDWLRTGTMPDVEFVK